MSPDYSLNTPHDPPFRSDSGFWSVACGWWYLFMVCNPPNGGGLDGTFLRCTPRHRHSPLNATIESRTHSQAQRWRSQTSQGECVLAPRTGARLSLIVYDMKRVSDLALHTTASRSVSSYPHVSPHQLIADLGHVLINRQLTWMCRPTSVIGGKADMARTCPYVS